MSLPLPSDDAPFDAFGNDDDSDEEEAGESNHATVQSQDASNHPNIRDASCGVLSFHAGTEQSLYHFVKTGLEEANSATNNNADTMATATRLLKLVDQYCYQRHWMMHVGPEKGAIVSEFLLEFCTNQYCDPPPTTTTAMPSPVILVELGTYCGYSTILMVQTILEFLHTRQEKFDFRIFSVDVDPHHQAIAQKLIQLAGFQEYITLLLLPKNNDHRRGVSQEDALAKLLQANFHTATSHKKIDVLFIDHDKDLYLADLQQLERNGMIQAGTRVMADNVLIFDSTPYRSHLQQLAQQSVVRTRLVASKLEYSTPLPHENSSSMDASSNTNNYLDGVELTVYLKDP